MDWNSIQNFTTNIVFGILLLTTILYWAGFIFKDITLLKPIWKTGVIAANLLLFFTLGSRWKTAGYFPLSNLYESLLFLIVGSLMYHLVFMTVHSINHLDTLSTKTGFFPKILRKIFTFICKI
jgi:ABC-type transport system involved in cytochrome c biogenesis permease subunit